MAVSSGIREIRQTLAAGTLTEIRPPNAFIKCMVGNGTGADLYLYTNDDLAVNEYRIISSPLEREVRAEKWNGFRHNEVAFWLKSAVGGLVVLEWT